MNEDMSRCMRFIVSGYVQGVAFRVTTQGAARRLGLSGFARNLPDGRVEVVACGDVGSLKKLESWLWCGPRWAQVEKIVVEEIAGCNFVNFETR